MGTFLHFRHVPSNHTNVKILCSHLKSKGVEISKETLATTFWVALKFYSSRDTIPNASFMGMVTKTTKHALIFNEPKVLEELGWDLYAFFKHP